MNWRINKHSFWEPKITAEMNQSSAHFSVRNTGNLRDKKHSQELGDKSFLNRYLFLCVVPSPPDTLTLKHQVEIKYCHMLLILLIEDL